MDGVIVDTKTAVKEAYRQAGVEMPDDCWGKPYHEWCSEEVHELKKQYYPECLQKYGEKLPIADLARSENSWLLTSASKEAIEAVFDLLGFRIPILGYSVTLEQKIKRLNNIDGLVIYYEDNPEKAREINSRSKTTVMLVSGCDEKS